MKRRLPLQPNNQALHMTYQLEHELVLCCASTTLTAEQQQGIKALVEETINWQYVIQSATRHGVLPLLYQNLNAVCRQALPEQILSDLQTRFRKTPSAICFQPLKCVAL